MKRLPLKHRNEGQPGAYIGARAIAYGEDADVGVVGGRNFRRGVKALVHPASSKARKVCNNGVWASKTLT